jgi:glycosyltransferase involved in cell wall biosynthesis
MEATRPGRLKVTMVVNGDIRSDARVRKSAQSVQKLGYDVTLLYGARGSTKKVVGTLGDVTTIGLPLPNPVTVAKAKRERERLAHRRGFPGFRSAAELEWARHQKELAGLRASRHSLPMRAVLRVPRMIIDWRIRYDQWREERAQQRRAEIEERTAWRVDWRNEVTVFSDLSLTFTREIWRQQPDIIHAHDAHVLEAAVNAANHMRVRGKRPRLIYDAHEYVAGAVRTNERQALAWRRMEAYYIRNADAVITVSEPIADALQRNYRLPDRPTVVLNAPSLESRDVPDSDIRSACKLDPDVPLIVYSGSTAPKRGVATVVQALTQVPDAHLAVVCVPGPRSPHAMDLARQAGELGVADRLYRVSPVAPESVLDFLRTADVGVHPMVGGIPNHEMALPNKLFDYVLAGLPVVVSDLAEMGSFVRRTGVGEVFPYDDVDRCAAAIKLVLADLSTYRERIAGGSFADTHSWESQEVQLAGVYSRLRARARR